MINSIRKRAMTKNAMSPKKKPDTKVPSKPTNTYVSYINPFATTIPPCLEDTVQYLEKHGLNEEGIFRVPGFMSQVKEMKLLYDRGQRADLTQAKGIHSVASLLKLYLSELREPVLTYELLDCFLLAVDVLEDDALENSHNPIKSCIALLPPGNQLVLKYLCEFLTKLAANSKVNCMTEENIAVCLAPAIVRRPETPSDMGKFLSESRKGERLLEIFIKQFHFIFSQKTKKEQEAEEATANNNAEATQKAAMRKELIKQMERGSIRLASNILRKETLKIKQFHTESDLSEFYSTNTLLDGDSYDVLTDSPKPKATFAKAVDSSNTRNNNNNNNNMMESPKPLRKDPSAPTRNKSAGVGIWKPVQPIDFSPQIVPKEHRRQPPPRRSSLHTLHTSPPSTPERNNSNGAHRRSHNDADVQALAKLLLQGNMSDANKLLQEKYSISTTSYEGDRKDGLPHGTGRLTFKSGDIYEGNFVNGDRIGHGKLMFKNGNYYEGDFVDGLRHGKGVFVDYRGNRYEGQFDSGKRTGYGKLTFASSQHTYEGQFEEGVPSGFGKTTFSNGDEYEGEHKADERHGFGVFKGSNGSSFKGMYVKGKREGVGYFISAKGSYYKGQFKENSMDGFGKFVFESGDVYIGQFVNGKFHGKGKYTFGDNNSFVGTFVDGQPSEEDDNVTDSWLEEQLVAATFLRPTDVPQHPFSLTFPDHMFNS